jgi:hypothetical protein
MSRGEEARPRTSPLPPHAAASLELCLMLGLALLLEGALLALLRRLGQGRDYSSPTLYSLIAVSVLRTILIAVVGLLGLDLFLFGVIGVVALIRGPVHGSVGWSIGGDALLLLLGAGALGAAWAGLGRSVVRNASGGSR